MSEPMDIGPTKVSKRRRASDDSGGDDGPPPKMNRIAGMYIGPNHLRYEDPDQSEPPMSDASSKEESHTERRESPTRCNRIWQNTGGWSFRDVDQRITAEQQKQWLASNNSWKYGLKQHWKGVKVLGMGGYGLVGLWEYQKGKDDVHSVVVKQSKGKDPSLKNESQILHLISKSKTKHVVKLLKQYHVERGKGTSKKFDPNDDYASRIYLEYCKNGDMQGLIRKLYKSFERDRKLLPEVFIWSVWECLARGLCLLQNGTENLDGPGWILPEIVHLDIKPKNVLIGDLDEQHTATEIFKIADFGIALSVPDKPDALEWLDRVGERGTEGWIPPEQWDKQLPHRMIGTPANVWQIGKCMYEMMRMGYSFSTDNFFYCYIPDLKLAIETYGRKILREEYNVYSDGLRTLILRCLARDPTQRPTPRELLRQCQESLKGIEPDLARVPGIPKDEPQDEAAVRGILGEAWFSRDGHTKLSTAPNDGSIAAPRNTPTPAPPEAAAPSGAIGRLYPDDWKASPRKDARK